MDNIKNENKDGNTKHKGNRNKEEQKQNGRDR